MWPFYFMWYALILCFDVYGLLSVFIHYSDVIMNLMASQITSVATFYSTFQSGADQRKHPSSASLSFMRGIHRGPVNSPHKGPVTRKMFPFDDVIMNVILRYWKFSCLVSVKLNFSVLHVFFNRFLLISFPVPYHPSLSNDDVIKWKYVARHDAENWCFLWSAPE